MSEDVRSKWDQRYTGEHYIFGEEPLPLLVEQQAHLPTSGQALDIACGEGRNTAYLAARGLEVVALDISAVALHKARELAERRGVAESIRFGLGDLERQPLPEGPFDAIVCVHYKQQSLCQPITEALAPGGLLVLELHTLANLEQHRRPSRNNLVEPNELLTWFPELSLVHYREAVIETHGLAQLVARKRP